MVKARFFEINACGGFQMAFYAEGLETEYEIGKEIAIFNNIDELIRRVKYYLSNEEDRKNIARRPTHLSPQCNQRFNQNSCLNGHVQATCNFCTT